MSGFRILLPTDKIVCDGIEMAFCLVTISDGLSETDFYGFLLDSVLVMSVIKANCERLCYDSEQM